MNDAKLQDYNSKVVNGEEKLDIDYSSSSGIDSKRDSSDDNCSEIIDNSGVMPTLSLTTENMNKGINKTAGINAAGANPDTNSVDIVPNNGNGKHARFSVNNVDAQEGNVSK